MDKFVKTKMPTETITGKSETSTETQYTARSFELVFSKFCSKYENTLIPFTRRGAKDDRDNRFMGLPPNASVQQMGKRLNQVGQLMGDSPSWNENQTESVDMREAVLLSARYLAWHTTMGGISSQYVDHLQEYIGSQQRRGTLNTNGHQSMGRLNHDRSVGISILLAQNHALRDYFDSGLAATLGNDSPAKMNQLLRHSPYMSETLRDDRARGISLEIAAKRQLEGLLSTKDSAGCKAAYGSSEQDARGGDLVVLTNNEILFIDLKSSMPAVFSDGTKSTPEDYEIGYKWLNHEATENKVALWAYQTQPVAAEAFKLQDERLAQNLEAVIRSLSA